MEVAIETRCGFCHKMRPASEYRTFKNGRTTKLCTICRGYRLKSMAKEIARGREAFNKKMRECKTRQRRRIIEYYGGKCACCGETEPWFLVIDHIHGGGNAQRRELGGSNQVVYSWIIRNNYPENMFRVLCHNCNMAFACHGRCPHQDEASKGTSA